MLLGWLHGAFGWCAAKALMDLMILCNPPPLLWVFLCNFWEGWLSGLLFCWMVGFLICFYVVYGFWRPSFSSWFEWIRWRTGAFWMYLLLLGWMDGVSGRLDESTFWFWMVFGDVLWLLFSCFGVLHWSCMVVGGVWRFVGASFWIYGGEKIWRPSSSSTLLFICFERLSYCLGALWKDSLLLGWNDVVIALWDLMVLCSLSHLLWTLLCCTWVGWMPFFFLYWRFWNGGVMA